LTRESGLLGLYWPARRQRLEDCGQLSYETLHALQTIGYSHYYFLGRSRRDALKRQLEITETNVLAALAKGVNRTDFPPRRPIPELGWSLSLWSGDSDDESYSISVTCGVYSKYVGNCVVLTLPPVGRFSISASRDLAMQAYKELLRIWDPKKAVLCEGFNEWQGDRPVATREPLAQHPRRSA
jgi:hypothetical protein